MRQPVHGVGDRSSERLLSLVADDRPDSRSLAGRLRELRSRDEIPAFAMAVGLIANLELTEGAAERLLESILAHREVLSRDLGRDPGLRVSALDFLSNVEPRLANPMIVEMSQLEEMKRSAVTDALTGLWNRRFFHTALEREVRRCQRYDVGLSLLMMDLDRFKRVNDTFGHLFGDLVLRRVGRVIQRVVRETDVACRYGGEEFTVVLPETDRLGAFAVAERIRLRVETSFGERPTGGRDLAMTLSGGVACYPDDARDGDGVIERADEALYHAKRQGRNRVAIHFAERRASVRFPARPSASAEIAPGPGSPGAAATVVNLSLNGALVETSAEYRPSEPVRMTLPRPAREGWVVPGRVVRVVPVVATPGGYRVGIQFDHPIPNPCLVAQTGMSAAPLGVATGGRS